MTSASTARSIAAISIQRPVLTWLIVLACFFGGLHGFMNIGRLEDPAFTIKEAIVFVPYPGATAREVEEEVTEQIETALQQMAEVDEIRSESSPGMAEIRVVIEDTFDGDELPQIWTKMRARIRDIVPSLPPGVGEPVIFDDFGETYGIFYAVTAEGFSDDRIRDVARMLRRELLVVDGVSRVAVEGQPQERIFIEVPQEELARVGLSYELLLQAIGSENAVVDAGATPVGDRYIRLDIPQTLSGVEAIENLLITPGGGADAIRLSEVATIHRAPVERPDNFIYHNNVRAFTLGVAGQADANIVDVGSAVEARLDALAPQIPLGFEMHPVYQQHVVVDRAINDFLFSLALSIAIVIGVLMLFMGWRAGLTVGSVLLLTVMGTIFFMNLFAIEMERISLGALIIAMGMLVDNAIVVTEGMLTGIRMGKRRLEAAVEAVNATQWPLLGATVIGIMAFSGIGLSPDATGEFLFSLFAVIGISLLLSWVLAVTVVPMIGFQLFSAQREQAAASDAEELDEARLYRGALYAAYRPILSLALNYRWLFLLLLIAMTMACYVGFGSVRQSFFPETNTPIFFVNMQLPEGTDILATDELAREVGNFVGEQPETVQFDTYVGSGATRFMLTYNAEQPSSSYAQIIVRTSDTDAIPGLGDRILDHVRARHPDVEIRADRIVFGPPSGAKLEARFSGPEMETLRALANEAIAALEARGNVIDIRSNWRNQTPVIRPVIVEERAQTAGVTRQNIADMMIFATEGGRIGTFREGDELIPIIARAPEHERTGAAGLEDRLVWSPAQMTYIPLGQVVSRFELESEEALIQRRDRVRTISVQANPLPGETATEAFGRFSAVIESVDLPPGYAMEWGGEHESSARANESLGRQLPLALVVMLTISFMLFAKIRQPLIIWAIVPMAVNGVVIGLLVTQVAFSFTALLGLLSLSGMLIKNAIVLVDEVDQRIGSGVDPFAAVRDGAISRLRPVLLAAVTTVLGMAPLLFDAFFQAMAVTIIGGLTFATILTMIAVPVLYALFFGIRPGKDAQSA
ncbi:efflux RND transporter permease subunit [Hyphobacterium sp.]|uniref:efflux RND transporter permease subunit n=1 Tax=Hyphobacterium sp. TaxID=2004662 RepID=UPI003B51FAC3